jgi:hypothetical protein
MGASVMSLIVGFEALNPQKREAYHANQTVCDFIGIHFDCLFVKQLRQPAN